MKTAHRKSLIPCLIFMLIYAWGGHLFSLAMVIHPPVSVHQSDAGHDHEQQKFHQTINISHQHPPQAADHLHDSVQLFTANEKHSFPLLELNISYHPLWIPNPPLSLIERPPRAFQNV